MLIVDINMLTRRGICIKPNWMTVTLAKQMMGMIIHDFSGSIM